MSMELMVQVMKVKVGNPLRKLVLLKLADNASDKGECWPSYQHIADQCEIGRRSVVSHIAALCAGGFLRKEVRKGPNGNGSNVYYLTPEKGDITMMNNFVQANKSRPSGDENGGAGDALGGAGDALGGAGDALGGAGDALGGAGDALGGGAGDAPESVTPLNQSLNQSLKTHSQSDKQPDDLPGKTEQTKKQKTQIDYQGCVDAYNEVLGDRLPWVRMLTDKRKTKIRLMLGRLKTPTVSAFRAYVIAFSENARSFYFGDNKRGWRADMDFILREETLVKVREGTISESIEVQE